MTEVGKKSFKHFIPQICSEQTLGCTPARCEHKVDRPLHLLTWLLRRRLKDKSYHHHLTSLLFQPPQANLSLLRWGREASLCTGASLTVWVRVP